MNVQPASGATLGRREPPATSLPWGQLPERMRVLYITGPQRTGAWLAQAFAADSAVEVTLEEAAGTVAGMARLREEVYDAVLASHEPGFLDALELIEGLRAGGSDEPAIVLGAESEQELAALCYEVGVDAYVCVNATTVRNLLWLIARAVERRRLIRENRRLNQADQQRLRLEHREAQRLLEQQRALVRDLESLQAGQAAAGEQIDPQLAANSTISHHAAGAAVDALPRELFDHYRELLRAYIIMGSGNLTAEMSALARLLAGSRITAPQTMQLHLQVLEETVRGLGTRSARHVMSRADLLVLEVMVHLTEDYRELWLERCHPPRQRQLPGFDCAEDIAA
jgi:DNA-binding NarL/FixJ family response regulator